MSRKEIKIFLFCFTEQPSLANVKQPSLEKVKQPNILSLCVNYDWKVWSFPMLPLWKVLLDEMSTIKFPRNLLPVFWQIGGCCWCYKTFLEEIYISPNLRKWKSLRRCLNMHKNVKTLIIKQNYTVKLFIAF